MSVADGDSQSAGDAWGDDISEERNVMAATSDRWDRFLDWADRFYKWSAFDDQLRAYKVSILAPALQAARDAMRRGEVAWPSILRSAAQVSSSDYPLNDLDPSYFKPFVNWCEANQAQARSVLLSIWDERRDPVERVWAFMRTMKQVKEQTGRDAVKNGMYGMQASFLLLGENPYIFPMYRDGPFSLAYTLTAYPDRPRARGEARDSGAVYGHALDFLDHVIQEAHARGLVLHDRLNAQSLVWCVTRWPLEKEPVAIWPAEDCEALRVYRDDGRRLHG